MALYAVPMIVEYSVIADVEAESADEARHKAEQGDVLDNGVSRGEMMDWDITGEPVRVDE